MKAEEEVERLESRMKENSFKKKQAELEEAASDKTMLLIDSGCIEQTELHVDIDKQTAKEALSREDMLDEVEKLMSALKVSFVGTVPNRSALLFCHKLTTQLLHM
jgi:3-keto-L-gulonate-6-phosphate decarboxylase